MRAIAGIVVLAVLLWSGWWYLAATAQKTALSMWLDGRAAEGWVAEQADISVSGYPNRVDATVSDLILADPKTGWAWSAPLFQVLMLSYQPNHAILVWPGEQKVSTPAGTAKVTADRMRGSIVFVPDTDLTLDRTQIELKDMKIKADGWAGSLTQGNFATRRIEEGDAPNFSHQIGLEAKDLSIPGLSQFLRMRKGALPKTMERAHFDVIASFDKPWDRHAVEGNTPELTALRIKDIELLWGKLELSAEGTLRVDRRGFPKGKINVEARNWRKMLDFAVAMGAISRRAKDASEQALKVLEMLSGRKDVLKVPLGFEDGEIYLGPVPIAKAPQLAKRR